MQNKERTASREIIKQKKNHQRERDKGRKRQGKAQSTKEQHGTRKQTIQ